MFDTDVDDLVDKLDEIADSLQHQNSRALAIARTKIQEARMWVLESQFEFEDDNEEE